MQQQLNQHLQAQRAMQNEINSLMGQVQAMNVMNSSIFTNVRWVMVQNQAIMRKLEIPINVNVEQHLPNAQEPIQPPDIDLVETGVRLGISPSPAVTTPPTVAAATNPPVAAATNSPVAAATPPPPVLAAAAASITVNAAASILLPMTTTTNTQRRTVADVLAYAPPLSENRNNRGGNVPTQNLDSVLQMPS